MKKVLYYILIFNFQFSFFNFLVGCQREDELPEATSAAKEVYLHYADRKDLTVALIGNYQGYNAVMLQAQDNESWLRLCEEFGVRKEVDADALDSTRVSSLKNVKGRSMSFRFDSIGSVGEALALVMDSIRREASSSDSFFYDGNDEFVSQMMENIAKGVSRGYMTMHIDTAYSVTHREHYDHDRLVDSSTSIGDWEDWLTQRPSDRRLMQTAQQYGNIGYLIHDDSDNLTLWLFFYSTMDEFAQIINNITSKNLQQ